MIPLPDVYVKIEAELRADTLTGTQASDAIHEARGKLGPPWNWRSWKQARGSVIGTCCEKCGAGKEGVLTLQHTTRLPKLGDYVRHVKYGSDYRQVLEAQTQEISVSEEPQPRKCCPKCASTAIVYRKRVANWTCNGKTNKRSCEHVFDEPSETLALTPQQKRDISSRKYDAYARLVDERRDTWLKEGILIWFQKMRHYLSLEDVKTLCRRCAFMEDKTTQEPCTECGFGLESYQDACPQCQALRAS